MYKRKTSLVETEFAVELDVFLECQRDNSLSVFLLCFETTGNIEDIVSQYVTNQHVSEAYVIFPLAQLRL